MINLQGISINDHTELKLRIMHLNAKKEEQEADLKSDIKELYSTVQPAHLFKDALRDLAQDPEMKINLQKLTFHLGTDFLARKLFGRNSTIKGYLSSLVLDKVGAHILNEYKDQIAGGIKKVKDLFKSSKNHSDENVEA